MSFIHGILGGFPPLETQPQSCLIMRLGEQVPGTHKIPSRLENVCLPLLPYPMTARMNIKLPYFPIFWLHLHLSGIPFCILSYYNFPFCMCPLYFLPPKFWTVTWPNLSVVLGSDVGGSPSSSVTPWYTYCLCTSCYLVLLGLRLAMELEVPLMFWLLPWPFV